MLALRLRDQEKSILVGQEDTRRDGIYPDAFGNVLGHVYSQPLCKIGYGRVGCLIGGDTG